MTTSTRGMSTELIESMVNEYIVKLEAGAVEPDDQKIAAALIAERLRLLTNTLGAMRTTHRYSVDAMESNLG